MLPGQGRRAVRRGRGGSRLGQGLCQAGEAGDHAVNPDQGEDAENRLVSRDDQPQPAALRYRLPMRLHQLGEPSRIAELRAGHVHHDRGVPAGAPVGQYRLQSPEVVISISAGAVITGTPSAICTGYPVAGIARLPLGNQHVREPGARARYETQAARNTGPAGSSTVCQCYCSER